MVGLAEGDAGAAAGHAAEATGREAAKEAVLPLGRTWRVGDGGVVTGGVVDLLYPSFLVPLHVRLGRDGRRLSGHCDRVLRYLSGLVGSSVIQSGQPCSAKRNSRQVEHVSKLYG